MTAPLIGITTSQTVNQAGTTLATLSFAYIQAIRRAGGVPVLIPAGLAGAELDVLHQRLDGILFTGGGDIDPALFNGRPHPRIYEISPERDQLEISLLQLASANDLPFMGICRGIQVINVALGGTLFTDIGDQKDGAMRHDWYPDIPRDHLAHEVTLTPGSRLLQILGTDHVYTNSLHHQGLERIAPSLKPVAFAPDGLVEGVELPGKRFALGVQWHPECLPDAPEMQALFKAFVTAAQ